MRTPTKVIGALAAAGLIAVGGTAYTASVTVPQSYAGTGSQSVVGATVSAIDYTMVDTDITQIEFDLDVSVPNVDASLNGGTVWYDCVESTLHYTCEVDPGVAASGVSTLYVRVFD